MGFRLNFARIAAAIMVAGGSLVRNRSITQPDCGVAYCGFRGAFLLPVVFLLASASSLHAQLPAGIQFEKGPLNSVTIEKAGQRLVIYGGGKLRDGSGPDDSRAA
jgi:hypothetical protein